MTITWKCDKCREECRLVTAGLGKPKRCVCATHVTPWQRDYQRDVTEPAETTNSVEDRLHDVQCLVDVSKNLTNRSALTEVVYGLVACVQLLAKEVKDNRGDNGA